MSTLFISHSSRDTEQTRLLEAQLSARGYRSVFLDLDPEKGIQAGTSWERTLYTKLRSCRAVVALCTDHYLASKWCFAEIALARMEGKDIFVLRADPWSPATEMPSILTAEQHLDLRQAGGEAGEETWQRLFKGLEAKGIVPEEHRVWGPEDPPYPGLRAFDEADAPIFFGRDREVRQGVELLSRVQRLGHPRAVMVLGSSGSGKSSLTRAGLLPRLRSDPDRWLVVGPFRPGREPTRALAAALAAAFDTEGEPRSWEEIHRRLEPGAEPHEPLAQIDEAAPAAAGNRQARRRLLEALVALEGEISGADAKVMESVRQLREFFLDTPSEPDSPAPAAEAPVTGAPLADLCTRLRLRRAPAEPSVVLVVDQFEELLGHDRKGPDHPASRFLSLLRDALESDDHPPLLLATMRSDYLGTLQRSVPLRGVGFKSLSVGPMMPEGMRRVIEEPAKLGQLELEGGLVERLLADTGTSDALPLLAFTLRVMWDRYRDDRRLDIREYEELGGIEGAIAQVAEETFEAAVELGGARSEQELRHAFLSLARPTEEGSGWARQPRNWQDMPDPVRAMLEPFVDGRLLVKRADGTIEVAHEALFRSWERLRGWLRTNAEALHLQREVQLDAAKWQKAASEEDKEPYLWRGGRLARALELRQGGVLSLEELDRSFIDASERAEQARIEAEAKRKRRELVLTRAFAAFMVVALVVVVLGALQIRRQARRTLSRQLAAQSLQLLDQQLDRALLVALAAGRVEDTVDARAALLAAVQHNPRLWRYLHGPGDALNDVALSPDATTLAAVYADRRESAGGVLLWSVDAGEPLAGGRLELPRTLDPVVAFSPDGRWLAVGGVDRDDGSRGRLDLWQLGGGAPAPGEGPPPGGAVNDLAFCGRPDSTLAWATKDRLFLRRPDGGSEELDLPGERQPIRRIAFSPDCGCLAIGRERRGSILFLPLATARTDDLPPSGRPAAEPSAAALCPATTLAGPDTRVRTVPKNRQGVRSLAFAPSGRRLAVARVDGTIDLWDLATGTVRLLERPGEPVDAVAWSAGGTLISAGRDGGVVVWDLAPETPRGTRLGGHQGRVAALAAAASGDLLASAGADGKAILWRLDRRQRLARVLEGHQDEVLAVAFDAAGERLVSGGVDESVILWDPAAGTATELEGNTGITTGVDFDAAGARVAAGGEDGSLHLWRLDGEGGGQHWTDEEWRPIFGVRFSPTENVLAAGANNQIVLWDLEPPASAGAPPAPAPRADPVGHETDIWMLLYGDDGRSIVASDTGGTVLEWDLDSGRSRPLEPAPGSEDAVLKALARSPDGSLLAAGGNDGCVHLWEAGGERPADCLAGPELEILAVAFGTDGRTLFAADTGADLRVWDLDRRRPLGLLRDGHAAGEVINSLAAGKTGALASAADDSRIAVWELDWPAVACDVARRELTEDEWREYAGDTARRSLCGESARMRSTEPSHNDHLGLDSTAPPASGTG